MIIWYLPSNPTTYATNTLLAGSPSGSPGTPVAGDTIQLAGMELDINDLMPTDCQYVDSSAGTGMVKFVNATAITYRNPGVFDCLVNLANTATVTLTGLVGFVYETWLSAILIGTGNLTFGTSSAPCVIVFSGKPSCSFLGSGTYTGTYATVLYPSGYMPSSLHGMTPIVELAYRFPTGGGGTYTDPGAANVLTGTTYTYGSAPVAGTATTPAVTDVLASGGYWGAGGTSSIGTYVAPAASNVVSGVWFGPDSGTEGTYPTSATSYNSGYSDGEAAQLSTDEAAVAAVAAAITSTTTVLGTQGTLDMSLYGLLANYSDPGSSHVVTGVSYSYAGSTEHGSYPTTATSYAAGQAAQLSSDQAAVAAVAAGILSTVTVLGTTGTVDLPMDEAAAAAAQLALDEAAVAAVAGSITTTATVLGTAGTLDMSEYALKSAVVDPSFVLAGHSNYTSGSAGTLTLPPVSTVLASAGAWGPGGNGSAGTLREVLILSQS